MNRRDLLTSSAALLGGAVLLKHGLVRAEDAPPPVTAQPGSASGGLPRVVTPNGASLPWRMDGNVKVFHLVAEPVKREFAP
jgi:manganese oxidase